MKFFLCVLHGGRGAVTRTRECSRLEIALQYKQDLPVSSRSRYCDEDTLKEYHIKSLSQRSKIAKSWRIRQIKKDQMGQTLAGFPGSWKRQMERKLLAQLSFQKRTWGEGAEGINIKLTNFETTVYITGAASDHGEEKACR